MTVVNVKPVAPTPVGTSRTGAAGKGWHFGIGAPADEIGRVGEMYLDVDPAGTFDAYGPKLGATWAGALIYPIGENAAEVIAAAQAAVAATESDRAQVALNREAVDEAVIAVEAAAGRAETAAEAAEEALGDIDLSNYYTKTELDDPATGKLDKSAASGFATAAQGALAETAIQRAPAGGPTVYDLPIGQIITALRVSGDTTPPLGSSRIVGVVQGQNGRYQLLYNNSPANSYWLSGTWVVRGASADTALEAVLMQRVS